MAKAPSNNQPSFFKRLLRFGFKIVYVVVAVLLLLEWAYRSQWIDFYNTEFTALNPNIPAATTKKRVLVLGDSYTATPDGYVSKLNALSNEYVFYNSGIPGTTVREAAVIAADRIEAVDPDLIIYQVYVGNDLFDYRHPMNWDSISTLRNVYWKVSDYFLSLRYLNYKVGQLSYLAADGNPDNVEAKIAPTFSPDLYSSRAKLYLKAEPALIENSVMLQNGRADDLREWHEDFSEIVDAAGDRNILVILIPHCSQVNPYYLNKLKAVGATFNADFKTASPQAFDYPFAADIDLEWGNRCHMLDCLPAFAEQDATGKRLFFDNDPHLNDYGHTVLAQLIHKTLQDK